MFRVRKDRKGKRKTLTEIKDDLHTIHYKSTDLMNKAKNLRYEIERLIDRIQHDRIFGGEIDGQ